MKSIVIKVALVAVVLGAGMYTLAGTASAARVNAVITVPNEVTVGRPVEVQASLRSADEGVPIAGVAVTFFTDASFGDVSGEVELGRAVTDENGMAILTYEPRFTSEHELRVEYVPPGESEPEVVTKSISVTDEGSQLHRSTAGVEIPGLNVWLLIAVVSTVWAILFGVALRVIAIARAGADVETLPASVLSGEMQPTASRSGTPGGR